MFVSVGFGGHFSYFFYSMPVASSGCKDSSAASAGLRHLLPGRDAGYVLEQYASSLSSRSSPLSRDGQDYFNTNSPPVLNLSPNLSPNSLASEAPAYDLRPTARRRSYQGQACALLSILSTVYLRSKSFETIFKLEPKPKSKPAIRTFTMFSFFVPQNDFISSRCH